MSINNPSRHRLERVAPGRVNMMAMAATMKKKRATPGVIVVKRTVVQAMGPPGDATEGCKKPTITAKKMLAQTASVRRNKMLKVSLLGRPDMAGTAAAGQYVECRPPVRFLRQALAWPGTHRLHLCASWLHGPRLPFRVTQGPNDRKFRQSAVRAPPAKWSWTIKTSS